MGLVPLRSRSRSRDRGFRGSRSAIDKAKLLAIAQKNAVKLLNSNDLKGLSHLIVIISSLFFSIQEFVLLKMYCVLIGVVSLPLLL